MREKDLFRNALVTLGATILAPLGVAVSGTNGANNQPLSDALKSYAAVSGQSSNDKTNNAKSDDTSKKDDNTGNNTNNESGSNDTASENAASQNGSQAAPAGYAAAKSAGTYTVKAGDTYGCIAEKYYGSYDQWQKVYDANGMYPGFDEYNLNVGATLQMPAVSATEALPKTDLCQ